MRKRIDKDRQSELYMTFIHTKKCSTEKEITIIEAKRKYHNTEQHKKEKKKQTKQKQISIMNQQNARTRVPLSQLRAL